MHLNHRTGPLHQVYLEWDWYLVLTLGPTVGGYIIEHFNWPLIFMINIPIGIIATILAYTFVEKKAKRRKTKKRFILITPVLHF